MLKISGSIDASITLATPKRAGMNKARGISFTIMFLFVSLVAFSATHKDSGSKDDPEEKPKYRASTGIGLNLLDLFMLRPVKQDSTVIRTNEEAIVPEKPEHED